MKSTPYIKSLVKVLSAGTIMATAISAWGQNVVFSEDFEIDHRLAACRT